MEIRQLYFSIFIILFALIDHTDSFQSAFLRQKYYFASFTSQTRLLVIRNAVAVETTGWNNSFASGDFIQYFWQRRPLLIRNAFTNDKIKDVLQIDLEDLATLSIDEDVESRIITQNNKGKYTLKHGHFDKREFQYRSNQNWTIMYQEVDRHIPRTADMWEEYFSFIPSWRRDDIMISYSMPGGGIGAHVDNYDVFLIQGSGQREWSIEHSFLSEREEKSREIPRAEVRLLRNFQRDQSWILNAGDMLYLPPRVPHRGITVGKDPGMTISMGFRAMNYVQSIFHFWSSVSNNCFQDRPSEGFYVDCIPSLLKRKANSTVISTLGTLEIEDLTKFSVDLKEKFSQPFQPEYLHEFHSWLGKELSSPTRLHRRKPSPFFLSLSSHKEPEKYWNSKQADDENEDDYNDENEDLKIAEPFYLRSFKYRIASKRIFQSYEELFSAIEQGEITLRRCEGVKTVFISPSLYVNGQNLSLKEFDLDLGSITSFGQFVSASRTLDSLTLRRYLASNLSLKSFFTYLLSRGFFYPVDI